VERERGATREPLGSVRSASSHPLAADRDVVRSATGTALVGDRSACAARFEARAAAVWSRAPPRGITPAAGTSVIVSLRDEPFGRPTGNDPQTSQMALLLHRPFLSGNVREIRGSFSSCDAAPRATPGATLPVSRGRASAEQRADRQVPRVRRRSAELADAPIRQRDRGRARPSAKSADGSRRSSAAPPRDRRRASCRRASHRIVAAVRDPPPWRITRIADRPGTATTHVSSNHCRRSRAPPWGITRTSRDVVPRRRTSRQIVAEAPSPPVADDTSDA
jgi:hypothetical protein